MVFGDQLTCLEVFARQKLTLTGVEQLMSFFCVRTISEMRGLSQQGRLSKWFYDTSTGTALEQLAVVLNHREL
jgi:hypothetical protein